ncbi:MAG: (d)CMP kinase [Candidatus Omnitrophica bacterium]|nr:(d)CMP kinase [Candidatus Omnitrophota bacterium]
MQEKVNVIAIDGPAGSGKSTVAKGVAEKLGLLYIDTGAMYRALTLKALKQNIDLEDEKALTRLSAKTKIELKNDNGSLKVLLDGKDVSDEIRELSVSQSVKYVARIKGVRQNMVVMQRALAEKSKGAVLEGRDIGTVVFPNAKYKFFLDASFEERVKRRFKEFESKRIKGSFGDVKKDVAERDYTDITRDIAPLKKARDAHYIDTTLFNIDEVVTSILENIK